MVAVSLKKDFFQAEDGIRDFCLSRGLGDVYKRQILESAIAVSDARQTAGLTQRELASLSHVPQSTIARIERGHNTSIETMSKIAVALNLSLIHI